MRMPPMMGSGMDMMTAPNLQMSPTKRMMNPHTWTTLRDPTCVQDDTLGLLGPKRRENDLKFVGKAQIEHESCCMIRAISNFSNHL